MILKHIEGASWRCGVGGGTYTSRTRPRKYSGTIIWKFNFSNKCKSWKSYKTTYWNASSNTNNLGKTYQTIDD